MGHPKEIFFRFVSVYETGGFGRNGRISLAFFPRRFSGVPGSLSARRKKERAHRERKTDRKTTCPNNFTLREICLSAARIRALRKELVRKRLRASLDTEHRSFVRVSSANVVVVRSVVQEIRSARRCLV